MRRVLAPGALAVLLAALPSVGTAQEEPAEEFAEELEVTEVLLDVVVTDKRDRIILGLGPQDFLVSEDGEAVDVTSVTFYSSKRLLESPELLAERDLAVETVPQDRFFILFVHAQRSNGITGLRRLLEAGKDFGRWLIEEAQPADRVAVVSYRNGLRVHQDFTTDREALLEAVDEAVRGRDPEKVPPSRRRSVPVEPAALSSLPSGKEMRKASKDLYRALRLVANAVSDVPGRKNVVFFGRGFGRVGTYGNYEPEPFKLQPTLQALNDANVAVYTLDLTPPEVEHNLQISLRDLAAATGGRFYWDRRHFTGSLNRISTLTSGYYLLSYESRRPAGSSGYQRVRVATRSPEFRIQARHGYLFGEPR